MRQKQKNPKRVHAGKMSSKKNRWIQHVAKCRKIRGESFKRGLMTCSRIYKRKNYEQFRGEIAMAAFEKGLM